MWLLFLLISSSGCTIKATLDITTDGTTEYLSSTTGKFWWTEDGPVKRGEQVRAFVVTNYDTSFKKLPKGSGNIYTHL